MITECLGDISRDALKPVFPQRQLGDIRARAGSLGLRMMIGGEGSGWRYWREWKRLGVLGMLLGEVLIF